MLDSKSTPPINPETSRERINIRCGDFGFHFTRDEQIPSLLQHGLLSRTEETNRGLSVRGKASRAPGTYIYFTTEPEDLYLVPKFDGPNDQYGDSEQSQLSHAVAVVVDRPDFVDRSGHFAIEHVVEPSDFRALIFIDLMAAGGRGNMANPGRPTHEFDSPIDPVQVAQHVDLLRADCHAAGIDIPICGVSGQVYYQPGTS